MKARDAIEIHERMAAGESSERGEPLGAGGSFAR